MKYTTLLVATVVAVVAADPPPLRLFAFTSNTCTTTAVLHMEIALDICMSFHDIAPLKKTHFKATQQGDIYTLKIYEDANCEQATAYDWSFKQRVCYDPSLESNNKHIYLQILAPLPQPTGNVIGKPVNQPNIASSIPTSKGKSNLSSAGLAPSLLVSAAMSFIALLL